MAECRLCAPSPAIGRLLRSPAGQVGRDEAQKAQSKSRFPSVGPAAALTPAIRLSKRRQFFRPLPPFFDPLALLGWLGRLERPAPAIALRVGKIGHDPITTEI